MNFLDFVYYNGSIIFINASGEGVKFIFDKIDVKNPDDEHSFSIRLENDAYKRKNNHLHQFSFSCCFFFFLYIFNPSHNLQYSTANHTWKVFLN